MHERELNDTIALFYAAATRPRQWEEAFGRLARLCGAEVAGVHLEVRRGAARARDDVQQRWHGLDPAFQAEYRAHYLSLDPWHRNLRATAAGSVWMGDELVRRRELERSAFHNDLMLRYGLDDLLGAILVDDPDELASMGLVRRRNRRFDERHKRLVARVAPHIARALAIGKRLLWSTETDQRPLVEECLRSAFPLTVSEARVAALVGCGLSPKEIAEVLGTSWNTVRAQLGRVFDKTGTGGQTKLARLVHGLDAGTRPTPVPRDREDGARVEEVLCLRYGLTPAEARVAARVGRGMSAKEAAASLGSRWNTVRCQLRQVYDKSSTSGRLELSRVVSAIEAES